MLLPNVANPTTITSIRLLLIMLTSLCTCEGKRIRGPLLTMMHVGCSSGNAMRPTTAVAAMSRGLFAFHRNKAATAAAMRAVSRPRWRCARAGYRHPGHVVGCCWADERHRPYAARVRLRQVYAELGGDDRRQSQVREAYVTSKDYG